MSYHTIMIRSRLHAQSEKITIDDKGISASLKLPSSRQYSLHKVCRSLGECRGRTRVLQGEGMPFVGNSPIQKRRPVRSPVEGPSANAYTIEGNWDIFSERKVTYFSYDFSITFPQFCFPRKTSAGNNE